MADTDKLDQIVKSSLTEQDKAVAAPTVSATGQPDIEQLQQIIEAGGQKTSALKRFGVGVIDPTLSLLQTVQQTDKPLQQLGAFVPRPAIDIAALRRKLPSPTGFAGGLGEVAGQVPAFAAPEALASKIGPLAARIGARILGATAVGSGLTPEAPLSGAVGGAIGGTAGEIATPILSGLGKIATQPIQLAKNSFNRLVASAPGGLNGVRMVLKDRLGNIAHDLSKGGSEGGASTPESVRQDLLNKITENYNKARSEASRAFDVVDSDPASKTFRFGLQKTPSVLKKKLLESSDKLKLLEGTGDVSEARENELQSWAQGKMNFSKRINNLSDSKIFRESLNADRNDKQLIERLPVLKRIIPEVKNNLDNELEEKIEGSGNEGLLNAWKGANEQYKNFKQTFDIDNRTGKPSKLSQIVGVENPNISQFLNSLVKPNVKNDDVSGIKELFSYLPSSADRDKVAFDIIKDGEDDPEKFIKSYARLGSSQKNLLFSKHREQLDQLQAAQKKFPSAFSIPKELTTQGKLFEATRIGGAIAAAPFTKGLSLLVAGTPLLRAVGQRPAMSRGLLQDILRRTSAAGVDSKLAKTSLLRPLLTSLASKGVKEIRRQQ